MVWDSIEMPNTGASHCDADVTSHTVTPLSQGCVTAIPGQRNKGRNIGMIKRIKKSEMRYK